jgi:hypothetical protein
MADIERVPVGRSLPPSWLPTIGTVSVVLLALAILKPWGVAAPSPPTAAPDPAARATIPPVTEAPADRDVYEPRLFGHREPDPAWELWPAGYVVEFGIAGPVAMGGHEPSDGGPEPGESTTPSPSRRPSSSAPPGATFPAGEPVVDLGSTDHLIALGINTPATVRVDDILLWFYRGENCCLELVPIVRLATPWPSAHFFAIGIADPVRPDQPGAWLIGDYRLDLVLDGGETRSILFRVTEPLG